MHKFIFGLVVYYRRVWIQTLQTTPLHKPQKRDWRHKVGDGLETILTVWKNLHGLRGYSDGLEDVGIWRMRLTGDELVAVGGSGGLL